MEKSEASGSKAEKTGQEGGNNNEWQALEAIGPFTGKESPDEVAGTPTTEERGLAIEDNEEGINSGAQSTSSELIGGPESTQGAEASIDLQKIHDEIELYITRIRYLVSEYDKLGAIDFHPGTITEEATALEDEIDQAEVAIGAREKMGRFREKFKKAQNEFIKLTDPSPEDLEVRRNEAAIGVATLRGDVASYKKKLTAIRGIISGLQELRRRKGFKKWLYGFTHGFNEEGLEDALQGACTEANTICSRILVACRAFKDADPANDEPDATAQAATTPRGSDKSTPGSA